MRQQSDRRFIGVLLKILRKLNKNDQCLCPKCKEKPINSHVIAESVLERLAHKGKVLRWAPSDTDIVRNDSSDQELERIYDEPKLAGIREEVNYPLFCQPHDNQVFEPLERSG